MSTNLAPPQKQLLAAISEILHYVWDPIDICGIPQARDEYDTYVGHIFTLLQSGTTAEEITNHLEQIVKDRMGLSSRKARSAEAADTLIDWQDYLFGIGA